MALIVWNDKLSIKIKSIDDQHKKLIELINDFYENITNRSNKENVSQVLSGLKKYIEEHFAFEEKYMKFYHYSDFSRHKQEHDSFIDRVKEIEDKFNSDQTVLSLDITSFLFDWLKKHIMISDKKYSEFFIENGFK
jgi:hemerythrin